MYYKDLETIPGAKQAYDRNHMAVAAERLAKIAKLRKQNKKNKE